MMEEEQNVFGLLDDQSLAEYFGTARDAQAIDRFVEFCEKFTAEALERQTKTVRHSAIVKNCLASKYFFVVLKALDLCVVIEEKHLWDEKFLWEIMPKLHDCLLANTVEIRRKAALFFSVVNFKPNILPALNKVFSDLLVLASIDDDFVVRKNCIHACSHLGHICSTFVPSKLERLLTGFMFLQSTPESDYWASKVLSGENIASAVLFRVASKACSIPGFTELARCSSFVSRCALVIGYARRIINTNFEMASDKYEESFTEIERMLDTALRVDTPWMCRFFVSLFISCIIKMLHWIKESLYTMYFVKESVAFLSEHMDEFDTFFAGLNERRLKLALLLDSSDVIQLSADIVMEEDFLENDKAFVERSLMRLYKSLFNQGLTGTISVIRDKFKGYQYVSRPFTSPSEDTFAYISSKLSADDESTTILEDQKEFCLRKLSTWEDSYNRADPLFTKVLELPQHTFHKVDIIQRTYLPPFPENVDSFTLFVTPSNAVSFAEHFIEKAKAPGALTENPKLFHKLVICCDTMTQNKEFGRAAIICNAAQKALKLSPFENHVLDLIKSELVEKGEVVDRIIRDPLFEDRQTEESDARRDLSLSILLSKLADSVSTKSTEYAVSIAVEGLLLDESRYQAMTVTNMCLSILKSKTRALDDVFSNAFCSCFVNRGEYSATEDVLNVVRVCLLAANKGLCVSADDKYPLSVLEDILYMLSLYGNSVEDLVKDILCVIPSDDIPLLLPLLLQVGSSSNGALHDAVLELLTSYLNSNFEYAIFPLLFTPSEETAVSRFCKEIVDSVTEPLVRNRIEINRRFFTEMAKLSLLMEEDLLKLLESAKWADGDRLFFDISAVLSFKNSLEEMLERMDKPASPYELAVAEKYYEKIEILINMCTKDNFYDGTLTQTIINMRDFVRKVLPTKGTLDFFCPYFVTAYDGGVALPETVDRFSLATPPKIAKIPNAFACVPSSGRPKKLAFIGSNLKEYKYLLKGQADTQLDKRVLQIFDVVNRIFTHDNPSRRVRGYSVVPISDTTGLVNMVTGSISTFLTIYQGSKNKFAFFERWNELIKDNTRQEAFKQMLADTPSDILHSKLYNSSVFIEHYWRKAHTFTDSCAVASAIGYIMGMGDRHLDNIMLDWSSGEVLHVDYSLCFEQGLKLPIPEIVPFRLTQNMVRAFGLGTEDGDFGTTFKDTLNMCARHRNELEFVLASFVYNPLARWRKTGGDILALEAVHTATSKLVPYESHECKALIAKAVSEENLSNMYEGWCPWF